jgi:serine/threonine protein kinase
MTRTNVQLGTPAYKSPEQATGRAVTARSDVFSLGSTLYYLATGKDLFDAEDPLGVIYQIAHEEPDLSDLEPELRDLVRACLAKAPADRPAPARIVELCAQAIGAPLAPAVAHDIPTAAPLIRARVRALRTLQRNPAPEAPVRDDSSTGGSGTTPPPSWPDTPAAPPPQAQGRRQLSTQAVVGIAAAVATLICVVAVAMVQGLNREANQPGSTNILESQSHSPSETSQPQVPPQIFTPPTTSSYSAPITATSSYSAPTTAPTSTSYAFSLSDLNDSSTDVTPQTPGAMLPGSFTDSGGRVYNLTGSSSRACANNDETQTVSNVLSSNHCSAMIAGSYVDTSGNILVSVNVVVLPNADIATSVQNQLRTSAGTGDLGWHCPKTGAGSNTCDSQIPSDALKQGWNSKLGRYVLWTDAIYVDRATSGNSAALNNGSHKASQAIGPDNYWFGK